MAIGAGEQHIQWCSALVDQEVYLSSQLTSIGRVLACFCSSHRSGRVLGIHRLPPPADPAALGSVVLDHPFDQLLEDAHPPPSLEVRQMLWIRPHDHAAAFSSLPSTSSPFSNLAPALTNATKSAPLSFLHLCSAASINLKFIAKPARLEPGPLVMSVLALTGANTDSIGLVVRRWRQCSAG